VSKVLNRFEIGTMIPYFALTRVWIASKSGPELTSSAVASSAAVPGFTRPRMSHGWTVTLGLARIRLAFPVAEDV